MREEIIERVVSALQDVTIEESYDAVINLAKELGGEFHQGATRMCIALPHEDEVFKFPIFDSDCGYKNYCEIEARNYEGAKSFGVTDVLLPITCQIKNKNGFSVYTQPKYSFSVHNAKNNWQYNKNISKSFCSLDNNKQVQALYRKFFDSRLSYFWFEFVYLYYGKAFTRRLIDWTHKYKVNDLHNGNTGFLHGRPIILDYAGITFDYNSEIDLGF